MALLMDSLSDEDKKLSFSIVGFIIGGLIVIVNGGGVIFGGSGRLGGKFRGEIGGGIVLGLLSNGIVIISNVIVRCSLHNFW